MSQYDLFGGLPPHVRESETSREAAISVKEDALTLRGRVRDTIVPRAHGATCDEVEVLTGLRHQTVSARVRELALTGEIVNLGERRLTRSGRGAVVWMVRR